MSTVFSIIIRSGSKLTKKGAPIYFRINRDGVVTLINCGMKVAPAHFDEQKEKIRNSAPDFHHINSQLEAYRAKALAYIYSPEGSYSFDIDVLEQRIFGREPSARALSKTCFYQILKNYSDTTPLTYSVMRLYVRTGERLKELYPKLNIVDVGFDVLNKFSAYLLKEYNNAPNTIRNHIKCAKAVVHYAQKMGLATNSTMAFMKCTTTETERHHLSCHEQKALYDLYMAGTIEYPPHHDTVGAFLLSSYTGLRYSDLKAQEGQGEALVDAGLISFVPLKTQKLSDKFVTIPLSDNANALIKAGALDKVFTNQRYNIYIKEVLLKYLDIDEKVTFHCARHTFASNCIEIGIPVEVIQQFLGHSKIATTMIYAKVSENVKADYMKKWNNLTNPGIAPGSIA